MKAIIISIRPEFVEKILNGKKTIEIRKTKPNCDLPCKVYIYCTKGKNTIVYVERKGEEDWWGNTAKKTTICTRPKYDYLNYFNQTLGRVVAEFTLNKIEDFSKWEYDFGALIRHLDLFAGTEGNYPILINYLNKKCKGFAWHIDNLKIYDKPKELSEFSHYIPNNICLKKQCGTDCEDCMSYDEEHQTCLELWHLHREIKRPPQSWCYVEDLEEV